jgi:hypothetical protein
VAQVAAGGIMAVNISCLKGLSDHEKKLIERLWDLHKHLADEE